MRNALRRDAAVLRDGLAGLLDEDLERYIAPTLNQAAEQPDRGAPETERILIRRWRAVRGEDTDQGIDPIRDADGESLWHRRAYIPGESGPVMLRDSPGYRDALAIRLRVMAPHDTLELRELINHLGDKVTLRQEASALSRPWISPDPLGY